MLTRGTQTQIRLNRPRVTHGRRHIAGAKLRVGIALLATLLLAGRYEDEARVPAAGGAR